MDSVRLAHPTASTFGGMIQCEECLLVCVLNIRATRFVIAIAVPEVGISRGVLTDIIREQVQSEASVFCFRPYVLPNVFFQLRTRNTSEMCCGDIVFALCV